MKVRFKKDLKEFEGSSKLLVLTGLILFILYFVAAISLAPGTMQVSNTLIEVFDCKKVSRNDLPKELIVEGQDCPSVTEEVVNLEAVNFEDVSFLKGTLRVWPAGELGSALVNTGVAQRALKISFDSLNETTWQIPAKQFIGSRTFEVPLNNSGAISKYPFDEYQGSWRSFLEDFQTSMSLASTLTVSERPIYGWEVSVEPIKLPNDIAIGKTVNLDGKLAFEWNANRSGSIKLSFFLLVAVMILGTASAIILTKSIYLRRRPPTLGALSWLATSLFAVLEIRSRFPGNPPLGISADLFVTYPVSVILLGLILTNTYFWINRDDWDMKNRPNESANF
jgi:hypothetical protein